MIVHIEIINDPTYPLLKIQLMENIFILSLLKSNNR